MEEFKEEINKVINGEVDETISLTLISPDVVDKYLKEEKGCTRYDIDSNGWDWDFWAYYEVDDIRYVLSGSGWYNRGLTFKKYEEE